MNKSQSDRNLDFDGMAGDGVNRKANRLAGNQWSGHSNDGRLVNKGRGPTKGNQDHAAMRVGPPATKDAYRAAPTSSLPAINPGKDMFTGRAQVRTPGGTRAWEPSAGQNYRGNIDQINIQPKGSNGMGKSQSTNPIAASKKPGNPDGINYGPKKQY